MSRTEGDRYGDDESRSPEDLPQSVLQGALRGDDQCWHELVRLYARRLFALANSRLRSPDRAEEVVQSVFATVATKFASGAYAEQGQFEAWLFRIAVNRIRDQIRRDRRSPFRQSADALNSAPDASTADHDTDAMEALRSSLQNLSDKDREIIELRHHAQMNFKQISDLLEQPLGTVLARHHRALAKLRDLLEILDHPTQETTSTSRPSSL